MHWLLRLRLGVIDNGLFRRRGGARILQLHSQLPDLSLFDVREFVHAFRERAAGTFDVDAKNIYCSEYERGCARRSSWDVVYAQLFPDSVLPTKWNVDPVGLVNERNHLWL